MDGEQDKRCEHKSWLWVGGEFRGQFPGVIVLKTGFYSTRQREELHEGQVLDYLDR